MLSAIPTIASPCRITPIWNATREPITLPSLAPSMTNPATAKE